MKHESLDIAVGGSIVRLGLCDLADLRPHEMTIEGEAQALARSMATDGVQADPIIVDMETNIVLDGMHRMEALRRLGARRALVDEVDYSSEAVRVARWLKSVAAGVEELRRAADELGMEEVYTWRDGISAVDSGEASAAMLAPVGHSFVHRGHEESVDAFWRAKLVGDLLADMDIRPLDDRLVESELLDRGRAVIYVANPSKEDVIRSGMGGRLYPPKSTRHVLPVRPLNVQIPLRYLSGADRAVVDGMKFIERRSIRYRILPPGSAYAGREYQEPLVIFG